MKVEEKSQFEKVCRTLDRTPKNLILSVHDGSLSLKNILSTLYAKGVEVDFDEVYESDGLPHLICLNNIKKTSGKTLPDNRVIKTEHKLFVVISNINLTLPNVKAIETILSSERICAPWLQEIGRIKSLKDGSIADFSNQDFGITKSESVVTWGNPLEGFLSKKVFYTKMNPEVLAAVATAVEGRIVLRDDPSLSTGDLIDLSRLYNRSFLNERGIYI